MLSYGLMQVVGAAAWPFPYDVRARFISELGAVHCGPVVCSPLHGLVGAMFVATGVLTALGAILLRGTWPRGVLATAGIGAWVLAGIGKIIVGLAPIDVDPALHGFGARNIPLQSIAILLLALADRRARPTLAIIGGVVGVIGLVGEWIWMSGPAAYGELGPGGAERLASYPGNLWVLGVGVLAVAVSLGGRASTSRAPRP
jgi:hypothetical protein